MLLQALDWLTICPLRECITRGLRLAVSVTVVCLLANFHLTSEGKGKITLTFAFLRAGGARSVSMGNLRTEGFLQKSQIYLFLKLNFG